MNMTQKKINVAVVGATGAVGQVMLKILAERNFPINNLYPLASARSAGKSIEFNNESYFINDLANFDFNQADVALFSAGGSVSAEFAPKAARACCIVIDNTSHFRYHDDVPLIIPEVNPEALSQYQQCNIIANPNCSTMQMLVALKPIYDAVGIARINVCTYQAVSGSGASAIKELKTQIQQWGKDESPACNIYAKPIAFNVLPHIDVFQENGYTKEEMKMVWETQKIFADSAIKVNPTAVRVPVFYGHSEAVHLETMKKISVTEAEALLRIAPGVQLLKENENYPTALTNAENTDPVYVGRVREDISTEKGLNLWVVADNLRKGAALNTVQIAELLLSKNYL